MLQAAPVTTNWLCFAELKSAPRTISRAGLDAILLPDVGGDFHRNLAEAFIRVWLRIISDRIGVAQVLANVFERLYLLLPSLGEVGLAARAAGNAPEHAARNLIPVDLAGRDHVDRDSFVFGHR